MRIRMIIAILLLSIVSTLLVGCTADYKLEIRDDNTVRETVKIKIPNSLLSSDNKKSKIKSVLDDKITAYRNISTYKNYDFSKDIGKQTSIVTAKQEYNSLKNYSNSTLIKNLFENVTIVQNEHYNVFQTVGHYYYDYLFGSESESTGPLANTAISNVVISIQLQNNVIETNADVKDETNNIYKWNLTSSDKEKSIYIKYGNKKRYDVIIKSFIMDHIAIIVVVGSLLAILLVGFLIIGGRYLLNNRI